MKKMQGWRSISLQSPVLIKFSNFINYSVQRKMNANSYGISDKTWSLLLEVLSGIKKIDRAVLFSSMAKGDYQKGSDIDITICGDHVNARVALDLSVELNENTANPYHFDVLAGNSISNPDLVDQIERVGRQLYKRSYGNHPET